MDTVWREFCSNASIHGIKLATSPRLSLATRLVFGSVLIASAAVTVLQIFTYWNYYRSFPLQVVEADLRTGLSEFYFPAVTVCSVFKIKMSRAQEHIERTLGKNATFQEKVSYWNTLVALSMQQYPHYNFPLEFIERLNSSFVYPIRNGDIPDIMKQVQHRIEDVFAECQWRGVVQNCSNIFKLQRTEEGFCYAFNSKTAEYSKNEKKTIVNNGLSGRNTGLDISLKDPDEKMDWRMTSLMDMEGYDVIVQNPEEMPDPSLSYRIRHSSDKINRITIIPKVVYADDNLKDIPSKFRDCYWVDESNEDAEIERNGPCRAQCRGEVIWKHCNCTLYFFEGKPGMKVCGIEESKCLSDVNVKLRNLNYHKIEKVDENDVSTDHWDCNCKKLCTSVAYSTQLISSPYYSYLDKCFLEFTSPFSSANNGNKLLQHHLRLTLDDYAHVDVSYLYQWGQSFRKELKFTFKDLSVTVGGYASLLLGCSLITILEVLYSILRLIGVLYSRAAEILRPRDRSKVITISQQNILYTEYPFLP